MTLLLNEMPQVVLGFWGTVLLSVGLFISIVLNAYTARWRSVATAAATEADVLRQRSERLQTELIDTNKRIVHLEAATDLQAVQTSLAQQAAESVRCHGVTTQLLHDQAGILERVVETLDRLATLLPLATALKSKKV